MQPQEEDEGVGGMNEEGTADNEEVDRLSRKPSARSSRSYRYKYVLEIRNHDKIYSKFVSFNFVHIYSFEV